MQQVKTSVGMRWLAGLALAGCAWPLVQGWRAEWTQGEQVSVSARAAMGVAMGDPHWVSGSEIAVQLRSDSDPGMLGVLSRKLGLPVAYNSALAEETDIARVSVPAGGSVTQTLATLRNDPDVVVAEPIHYFYTPQSDILPSESTSASAPTDPNAKASGDEGAGWKPNDPRYNEQWNFQMVKAEQAWSVTRGKGTIVAVIDTGVAYGDTKKGKIGRDFKQTRFVPGYDFVNRDALPNDDNGHGTHVSGTIAESTDNGEGVAGLAFEAQIMPIKVLSAAGGGTSADIAEAIRWAADHGANVINMSLGSPIPDKLMGAACQYAHSKGVTIVCAAGNSGREGVGYPAAYPDCIAVSSVGPKGDLSFYSSWGKQVAIAAPGGDSKVGGPAEGKILQNTVLQGENGPQDDYYAFQGTSMASPHVAAVAALIESQGVKDPEDVKCVLQKSAVKKGPANKYGAGIVDAEKAAKLAANVYGDGVVRFWMVAGLYAGCWLIGRTRRKNHSTLGAPFWATTALAFGLVFPDWLTGFVGLASHWNILAHSILIPGALLVLFAENKTERRLLGWMACGLSLHLGWEFLRGTTPMGVEPGTWQMLPWVASNVAIGFGMLLAGLNVSRE